MRIKYKSALALAATAAATATFTIVSPSPAFASDQSCVDYAAYEACASVIGGGLYIDYTYGSFFNFTKGTLNNIHIELSGPNGLLRNCAQVNLASDDATGCKWAPNWYEPAGNYCSTVWEYTGGGSYVAITKECAPVT